MKQRGLPGGDGGRKKLCMIPCHSCHIYRNLRSKEVGEALKPLFGMTKQATNGGDSFYGEGGFSLCNAAVLKHYCLTEYC